MKVFTFQLSVFDGRFAALHENRFYIFHYFFLVQQLRFPQLQPSVFPQHRKLGVFSHSKGSRAGRSSQIRTAQDWEPGSGGGSPFPRESLGAAESTRRRLGTGFPGRGSQARFPGRGSQARFPSKVPGTGSQVRFPRGSQEQVPRQGFPSKASQQEVPKQGSQEQVPKQRSQARFPSKVPSKVPKQGSQARFQEQIPKQGFPARGSAGFAGRGCRGRFQNKQGSKEEVPMQGFPGRGFQEQVPKQGSQKQVLQAQISGTVFNPGSVSQARFPGTCFSKQNKVSAC